MKKTWMILTALAFVGCSSAPTQEDSNTGSSSTAWEVDALTKSQSSTETSAPALPPPPPQGKDAPDELRAAIKSQSDERMKLAAEQVLRSKTDDPLALNTLGLYHFKQKRYDLAAHLFNKAIQKDPKQSAPYTNLGLVYLARNETPLAIRTFRKALDLNSRDGVAAANLGALYVEKKDYTKAVVVLETAYRQGFRDVATLNNYGVALMATGKTRNAKDMFETAMKDSSSHRELLMNYAILLIDHLGNNELGLETVNRLKFLGPPPESRERVSLLENKAKAGLK